MAHLQAQLSTKPTQVMYLMKCIFNFQGPLGELSPIRSRLINFSPIRTGRDQVVTLKPKYLHFIYKKSFFQIRFGHKKTPTFKKASVTNLLFMYMIKNKEQSLKLLSIGQIHHLKTYEF